MAKILIVDDDQNILEEFRNVLLDEGHEVEVAVSGDEALRHYKAQSFDLVFLDVQMPRMQGLEILEALQPIRRVPVVMMSGFMPLQKEADIMEHGADVCLRKPLDLERVRQVIYSLTQQRQP